MDEELEGLDAAFTYLPVGSVVMLVGGERPVVVAGVMACDGNTGKYWDYLAYPYPEGRQDATQDHFFDMEMVEELLQLGFVEREAVGFQLWLAARTDEYRKVRERQGK